MKRVVTIFSRIFRAKYKKADPVAPMPSPASISNLHEMHNRSTVAWIAFRLAQLLEYDQAAVGSCMFMPFIQQSFEETGSDDKLELINLANQLMNWIYEDQDVYLKLKEAPLTNRQYECLLKVFEEIREDIRCCLPTRGKVQGSSAPPQEHEHWEIYRDVIYAATQRKLLLIPKEEVSLYKQGKLLCEAEIKARPDIPNARNIAKDSLLNAGIPQSLVMGQLLIISEAITNILKHATEGRMLIVEHASDIMVIVEDQGPGIPMKVLPNATLLAGYSTKKSLGQGFTLMLKMAEEVLLSTSNEGTTIILKFIRKGILSDDINE